MEGGPRNESIILQLDSESRFRDALEKKKKLKEEKGWSRSPKREKKKKNKSFGVAIAKPLFPSRRLSTLGSILLFETESRSI